MTCDQLAFLKYFSVCREDRAKVNVDKPAKDVQGVRETEVSGMTSMFLTCPCGGMMALCIHRERIHWSRGSLRAKDHEFLFEHVEFQMTSSFT